MNWDKVHKTDKPYGRFRADTHQSSVVPVETHARAMKYKAKKAAADFLAWKQMKEENSSARNKDKK